VHPEIHQDCWHKEHCSCCCWIQTRLLQFFPVRRVWGQPINKLQRVQNSLARIVLSYDIRSNAKQNLADLHWLPVRVVQDRITVIQINYYTSTHLPIQPTSILNVITSSPLQRPLSASRCWGQNCFQQSRVLPRCCDNLDWDQQVVSWIEFQNLEVSTCWSHWQC